MTKKTKSPLNSLHDALAAIDWPSLKKSGNRLYINRDDDKTILEKRGKRFILYFVYYYRDGDEYGYKGGLEKIIFDKPELFKKVVYTSRRGYDLNRRSQVNSILKLNKGGANNDIESLDIRSSHSRFSVSRRTKVMKVPAKKYLSILRDANTSYERAGKYRNAVERHLTNQLAKKHINEATQRTTTIEKGEFSFAVHRLNLQTKEKKGDYLKYLDSTDMSSLKGMFRRLVRDEVFDESFLRELDEYFIREKLEHIITLGRKILDLGSTSVKTKKAAEAIELLGENVGQLEGVWQQYFEKYLLYLIFSYREIYPKIQLELDADKKYPDFIGINHYYGVDAIEIKTHLTPALMWDKSHKNFSFSGEMSKAIIQTMNYLEAIKQERFKHEEDRERITETTDEENVYRPRGIIIISSAGRLVKREAKHDKIKLKRDLTKLRNSLHNIEILTFDEVLNIADNYKKNIVRQVEDGGS